jgi:hypothetical protein
MHQHVCPECDELWDCDDLCDPDEVTKLCPACRERRCDPYGEDDDWHE